jgi:hypothetical protein
LRNSLTSLRLDISVTIRRPLCRKHVLRVRVSAGPFVSGFPRL